MVAISGDFLISSLASAQDAQTEPRARNRERFERGGPRPGTPAPDFELKTLAGKVIRGSDLWAGKPAVIMTGSETCPVFRREAQPFERLAEEFREHVNFVIIYTLEAHPEGEAGPYRGGKRALRKKKRRGVVGQPKEAQERAQRAASCVQRLGLRTPVVLDTMDNATWKVYGSAPNCAYLVGRDGKVVEQQGWFKPQEMRKAIESLLSSTSHVHADAGALVRPAHFSRQTSGTSAIATA